jgi:hypothetical protein
MSLNERAVPPTTELLRFVNEAIAGVFPIAPDDPISIVCECERRECGALILVPFGEFTAAIHTPVYFVVPGHGIPDGHVLRAERAYAVVECGTGLAA